MEGSEEIDPAPIDLVSITSFVWYNNDNSQIPMTHRGKHALDKKLKFKISGKDSITLSSGTYFFSEIKDIREVRGYH